MRTQAPSGAQMSAGPGPPDGTPAAAAAEGPPHNSPIPPCSPAQGIPLPPASAHPLPPALSNPIHVPPAPRVPLADISQIPLVGPVPAQAPANPDKTPCCATAPRPPPPEGPHPVARPVRALAALIEGINTARRNFSVDRHLCLTPLVLAALAECENQRGMLQLLAGHGWSARRQRFEGHLDLQPLASQLRYMTYDVLHEIGKGAYAVVYKVHLTLSMSAQSRGMQCIMLCVNCRREACTVGIGYESDKLSRWFFHC
jgi:hypothetical protein